MSHVINPSMLDAVDSATRPPSSLQKNPAPTIRKSSPLRDFLGNSYICMTFIVKTKQIHYIVKQINQQEFVHQSEYIH